MRVIAGIARGRRLEAPRGTEVRPTTDRVKEALFSILLPRLRGAAVLDLYAGSGALGIEALSRGAATATFVDRDRRCVDAIRRNLHAAGLADRADVRRGDLPAALVVLTGPFDVVLADPPYDLPDVEVATTVVQAAARLDGGGVIVVERDRRSDPPSWPSDLNPLEARRYGDTTLHLAEKTA